MTAGGGGSTLNFNKRDFVKETFLSLCQNLLSFNKKCRKEKQEIY